MFDVLHLVVLPKLMLNFLKMKTLLMTSGLVVSARRNYPILVQLRWVDVRLNLSSNRSVDVVLVVVADGVANHATLDDATFALVDGHSDVHVDAMICPADVVVLFLSDVVMQTSNVMLKMVALP